MDTIKLKLILKWTNQYIKELLELKVVCSDEQLNTINDLIDDLEICEKVYQNYHNMLG